jgi:fructokinase
MTEKQFTIIGIGEVLWDVLPDGKQLGGAPANFAYIAKQLGNCGIIASRVGNDSDGNEILQNLAKSGVDVLHVQKDLEHATGTVKVSLENGQPNYEITENVAWDFLELGNDWSDLAKNCDAVCFGTLAQRNEVSQKTIREFLHLTRKETLRIFDINLRQNYFSKEILRESLKLANILKLNHDELPIILETLEIEGANELEKSKNLIAFFELDLVCLTRSANGSVLFTKNELAENSGKKIKIKDTIGAGDSFTAAMTHGILRGWSLKKINDFANKVGAFVASNTGAMPDFPKEF